MINTKKVLLIILTALIPFLSIYIVLSDIEKSTEDVKGVSSSKINGCIPYVSNLMPNIAKVGKEYIFYPNVLGCPISQVDISVEGANWLTVKENEYIYGIPDYMDVGTYEVVIEVKGLYNTYTNVEYIIVE